ncbi:hypothetical protein CEP54_003636 [Fusarium duplospermum]|uniref:Hsp70 protein n=1 Tax=Fusarium duplospermum TaxID=1325734 RepID=A0A428QMU0_9HYPO|nr:hypothetical protein CEP54_003636 [Fusarium duplospermum]
MSTTTEFRDIHPWTEYPGSTSCYAGHCEKVPSLVAFASDNEDLEQDKWGYRVEPHMKACSWTKLLLDGSARASEYDDPKLKKAIRSGIMKLPPGRTAKEIVTIYFRGLNRLFEGAVAERLGAGSLDDLPVDFWFTVPATWSDKAKQLTLEAARDAGIASRPHDRIHLISEPEAAAHLALKSSIHFVQDLIEAGAKVMVCDLGGGTVDITSYEVQSTSPKLKLRELCVGGGGKCGGTFVDRNFYDLMEKRYGKAFTSLDPIMTGPGSHFMVQFETAKRDFSLKNRRKGPTRLLLPMTPTPEAHYDERFGYVLISHEDMKGLFDPVGDMVLALVSDQVKRVRRETNKNIDHMVLVGGFGSSPYMKERLQEWCLEQKIRLTTPWVGAWSAVNDVLDANWKISQVVCWQFKGRLKQPDAIPLLACSSDKGPETIETEDIELVGYIRYTLDKLDLNKTKQTRRRDGSIAYLVGLTLNIRMSDEDGMFVFKILHEGEECGTAKLAFSYTV